MSAAAVIILRRKRFVRRFRELGAISPDRAVNFDEVGLRRSWIFDQMVDGGVFVPAGDNRFYMKVEAAEDFLARQRRRARIFGGVMLLIFAIFFLWSLLR